MVDPELFARYQQALGANADLAKRAVEELLSKLDGLTPLEQAEYLLANYPKLVRAYGKVAADVARQYYQESRDGHFEGNEDTTEYTAQTASPIQERWAAEDVQKVAQDGLGYLPKVAVRRVMQRADQTLAYNVRRDPARGRWAVVPHPGACGWCILIAGNGWAYSERSVNAQRHDGCKCSVAVDFDRDNPSLVGYNPKAMQQAYADAYDTVRDDLQRQWDTLPDEKKAKYLRKGGRGFDGFRRDQIVAEMNRRNRDWLQDGVPRYRTKEPGAKPPKKERDVGTALLFHGFDVEFIKEVNRSNTKTADARLNGEVWEFKIPEGWNGEHTIRKQFFKAKDKGTNRLLISATKNGANISEMRKWVLETFRKGDYDYIDEVLLMSADGESIERLLR